MLPRAVPASSGRGRLGLTALPQRSAAVAEIPPLAGALIFSLGYREGNAAVPKKPLPDHPLGTLAALDRLSRLAQGMTQTEYAGQTSLSRELVAQRERGITQAHMRHWAAALDERVKEHPSWSSSKRLLVYQVQALVGRDPGILREFYESDKHKELREYVQQCADELGVDLPPKPLGEPASEANLALPWDKMMLAADKHLAALWPGLSADARRDRVLEACERALRDERTAKADNPTGKVCGIAHNVALERHRTKKDREQALGDQALEEFDQQHADEYLNQEAREKHALPDD